MDDPVGPQVCVVVDQMEADIFGSDCTGTGQLVAEGQVDPAVKSLRNVVALKRRSGRTRDESLGDKRY